MIEMNAFPKESHENIIKHGTPAMNDEQRIVFFHPQQDVCDYVNTAARFYPSMSAICADVDAVRDGAPEGAYIVTAGNSFGIMDGGMDKAVAEAFPGAERDVRQRIAERFAGEMPVGAAFVLAAPVSPAAPLRRWTAEDITWAHAMDMHARWHQMTGVPESEPFPAADGAQAARDGK